jgi:hypothetical protein
MVVDNKVYKQKHVYGTMRNTERRLFQISVFKKPKIAIPEPRKKPARQPGDRRLMKAM